MQGRLDLHNCYPEWPFSLSLSQNPRMQQPLSHLYFLTLLEHLQAKKHIFPLSYFVRFANSISQQCANPARREEESILLWVELQVVVQVILQKLATHLDPSELHVSETQRLADDINR